MSLAKYLEKASTQRSKRYQITKISDGKKLDIMESMLYAAFKRKNLNNLNLSRLPKELMGVKLNWISSDGAVEMVSGPLRRTRNFNSERKGPGGQIGEFATKKSAFGIGIQPELRVEAGDTKVLKAGVKHDYKKIILEEGAKIVSDKSDSMLILLASEEFIMKDKSKIDWIGEAGTSSGQPSVEDNGEAAPFLYDTFNGDFNSVSELELKNGGDGSPNTGGESGGIIWIEAKKFVMGKNASVRSIGGDGGSSPEGNGAGGNGGLISIKTQIGIGVEKKKLAVTSGKSAGNDGFDGVKDVEFLK